MSEQADRHTDTVSMSTPQRLIVLGVAALVAPVAACGAEEAPKTELVQSLPLCTGAPEPAERFDGPKPKTLAFNAETKRFDGQPALDPVLLDAARLALAKVVNFDYLKGGAGTGNVVQLPSGVKVMLTAGHATLMPKPAEPNTKTQRQQIGGNTVTFAGDSAIMVGWGCSLTPGGAEQGADVSAIFPYIGLKENAAIPLNPEAGCPDGQWVTLTNLQGVRQPGDPAVSTGYMTHINDGSGRCVVITGMERDGRAPESPDNPYWQVRAGASGGAVVLDGQVIATVGGSVNPGGSTDGVESWTAAQVQQYTGTVLQGAPTEGYAVAWVVTGKDLEKAGAAAVETAPDDMKK